MAERGPGERELGTAVCFLGGSVLCQEHFTDTFTSTPYPMFRNSRPGLSPVAATLTSAAAWWSEDLVSTQQLRKRRLREHLRLGRQTPRLKFLSDLKERCGNSTRSAYILFIQTRQSPRSAPTFLCLSPSPSTPLSPIILFVVSLFAFKE